MNAENPLWTLEEALRYLRTIEAVVAQSCNAHVGLAGGVLLRGQSFKDLDILIYGHNKKNVGWVHTLEELKRTGLIKNVERSLDAWLNETPRGSSHYSDCEYATIFRANTQEDKRVDLFFVQKMTYVKTEG